MKYQLFQLGPITVYSYGFMIALGFILCVVLAERRSKAMGLDSDKIVSLAFWCIGGGLLGAKVLYYVTEIKSIIENPKILLDVTNGFVVYGGILGGILGGFLFVRRNRLNFLKHFDLAMPSVSLAQGFGRIGCFLAGCCYGRETDGSWGVVFHDSPFAPDGVALIPTQLISSAGDFLICLILCLYARRKHPDGAVGGLWLLLYSIGRFVIEFFRGDPRGSVGMLSTSQFIAIFILAAGAACIALVYRRADGKE